jgi:hypothetical protein
MPEDDIQRGRKDFPPPAISTRVQCIHCGQTYDSYLIQFVPHAGPDGRGVWRCPTPQCDGAGFMFDIWPTDPNWIDENGNKICCQDDDGPGFELNPDDEDESDNQKPPHDPDLPI